MDKVAASIALEEAVNQSDYDKIRRIPYLIAFNIFTAAALLCTVTAPLALFGAELGVPKDRLGLITGILPFVQVLSLLFLPLVMAVGHRHVATFAYLLRYFWLALILFAPMFEGSPDAVFLILFTAMLGFSVLRTIAETAVWPWSQEYMPAYARGRITGGIALAYLPVALIGSVLVKLWLDGQTGIDRFFPVFAVGLVLGAVGALTLLGLGGGRPRPDAAKGFAAIRAIRTPMRDGNFLLYLLSSGTQFLVFVTVNLFMLLFFRERLGVSSGQIVLLAALIPFGAAVGSVAAGWFVDRYGTRAIRVILQAFQAVLLIGLMFLNKDTPGTLVIVGLVFFVFGLLFQSSISVGGIYMLNYVPPEKKESYMTLAYMTDGLIGGGVTFLAGALLEYLSTHSIVMSGIVLGSFETLFALAAVVTLISAVSFAMLREEHATGIRDFLRTFRGGRVMPALWGINRYGALTSEERRRDLTYGFGASGSPLVKEELIAALTDPSFDVRHEAIQSLGHLPASPATVAALESVLGYEGLVELQYAALNALGRIGASGSGDKIARFLDSANSLLRARAIRSLGDIKDQRYLPRIRALLVQDPEIDCRLAAVSALGKFRDRASLDGLLQLYRALAGEGDTGMGEPRSKVVLLAISKLLGVEEGFSREWRMEEKATGSRLPGLVAGLGELIRKRSKTTANADMLVSAASSMSPGRREPALAALQNLRPHLTESEHPDRTLVLELLDGTRAVAQPHPALLVLLSLAIRRVLAG